MSDFKAKMHQIQFRLGSGGAITALPRPLHLRGPTSKGGKGERKVGGERKGEREKERRREGTPKGWLTPPQVPNPEKYPVQTPKKS